MAEEAGPPLPRYEPPRSKRTPLKAEPFFPFDEKIFILDPPQKKAKIRSSEKTRLKIAPSSLSVLAESLAPEEMARFAMRRSRTTRESGASDEGKLIKTLEEQLQCGICLALLREPRAIICGHTFCLTCLKKVRMDIIVCADVRRRQGEWWEGVKGGKEAWMVQSGCSADIAFTSSATRRTGEEAGQRARQVPRVPGALQSIRVLAELAAGGACGGLSAPGACSLSR